MPLVGRVPEVAAQEQVDVSELLGIGIFQHLQDQRDPVGTDASVQIVGLLFHKKRLLNMFSAIAGDNYSEGNAGCIMGIISINRQHRQNKQEYFG